MPKSVLRAVLGRMQFTLQATRRAPHGASRLVRAMSAWLVKTRRAPSRHRRGARVYDHATTTMPKLSTPPPPPALFVKTGLCAHGVSSSPVEQQNRFVFHSMYLETISNSRCHCKGIRTTILIHIGHTQRHTSCSTVRA